MLETRVLYYFLAVAREQNITKAAEVLHISQPSLSTQMKQLEKELGKQLFVRSKKKTVLTDDGAVLRSRAEEIITLVEKCSADFGDGDAIAGTVTIGAAETKNMAHIADILSQIQNKHKNVRFHIISGMAEEIHEKLSSGAVDVGIMINPARREGFNYIKLNYEEVYGLIIKKDSPLAKGQYVTLKDISDLPIIMSDQNISANGVSDRFCEDFEKLNIVSHYNLIYNAVYMAERDMGCLFAIDGLVDTQKRGLDFRPFFPPFKANLYAVTKKYKNLSAPVKLFLKLIEES